MKEALSKAFNLAKVFYQDPGSSIEEVNGFIIGYNTREDSAKTDNNSTYLNVRSKALEQLKYIEQIATVSEDFKQGFIKGYCILVK